MSKCSDLAPDLCLRLAKDMTVTQALSPIIDERIRARVEESLSVHLGSAIAACMDCPRQTFLDRSASNLQQARTDLQAYQEVPSGPALHESQQLIDPERLKIVEAIANDPANVHGLSGFWGNGWRLVGYKYDGAYGWHPGSRHTPHEQNFGVPDDLEERLGLSGHTHFLSRLGHTRTQTDTKTYSQKNQAFNGIVFEAHRYPWAFFRLDYTDTNSQYDNREGVTTVYSLFLPENSNTVSTIQTDPTLLIDLMRTVFPAADRSEGKLQLANVPVQTFEPGYY